MGKVETTHQRYVLVSTGLSFQTGLGINQLILIILQRARPYELGISKLIAAPSLDPSFLSDHSTSRFTIATALLLKRCPVLAGIHVSVVRGALIAFLGAFPVHQGYLEGSIVNKWIVRSS